MSAHRHSSILVFSGKYSISSIFRTKFAQFAKYFLQHSSPLSFNRTKRLTRWTKWASQLQLELLLVSASSSTFVSFTNVWWARKSKADKGCQQNYLQLHHQRIRERDNMLEDDEGWLLNTFSLFICRCVGLLLFCHNEDNNVIKVEKNNINRNIIRTS